MPPTTRTLYRRGYRLIRRLNNRPSASWPNASLLAVNLKLFALLYPVIFDHCEATYANRSR